MGEEGNLAASKLALICTAAAAPFCAIAPSIAGPKPDPARIAIIDASVNTTPYLDVLANAGVKVIGRYYSRCPQPELVPEKRIIDNEGEIEAILTHKAGFAILSIYQYYNNNAKKFDGMYFDKFKKKFFALPADNECSKPADPPNTTEKEAALDVAAAVRQALSVGQPKGSAIYFGVDYNYSDDDKDKVLRYFTVVSNELRTHGYLVGVYGNGAAITLLTSARHADGPFKGKPLVDLAWLNSARSHAGSIELYRSGKWDLLQTKWDFKFPAGELGAVEIDTNIQNKERASKYIGFWSRDGLYKMPEQLITVTYDKGRLESVYAGFMK
ncbi:MAG TPA: DUF1906 domain-containing protein [Hyphomicrobiales bacterium]|nr:DUF1906 domain-containing protein [Hyphomicrobiales bacterium]